MCNYIRRYYAVLHSLWLHKHVKMKGKNKCYEICIEIQMSKHLLLTKLQALQIKLQEKARLKNTDTILILFITKIGRIATLEYLKNTRIATRKWLLGTED
jgi:hypothetical protein